MGGGVKIDGANVGVAVTVVKGEEGAIWVTGSCIGVVPFTRGVAEICVCSWTGFVPSGIESSFLVAACAVLYRILQCLYDTAAYAYYSASVASAELL